MKENQVLIVGGGVAGLSTGIRLQESGIPCTIFEKNETVGGNLTGWDRGSYHIDNCMHWLTGTNPKTPGYAMWRELGALQQDTQMIQNEDFYASEFGGETLHFWADSARTRRQMLALSPQDKVEIHRFFDGVETIKRASGLGDQAPTLIDKVNMGMVLLRYGRMSLWELANRFQHPLLRRAMTDYIGGPFNAAALLIAYAHFSGGNGCIPKGGSRQMAQRMANRFTSLGGEIRNNVCVERIMVENGIAQGVVLRGGERIMGSNVICTCDPTYTFGHLTRAKMPHSMLRRYRSPKRHPIFSAFHCAFALHGEALPVEGNLSFECAPLLQNSCRPSRLLIRTFPPEEGFSPAGEQLIQCMIFQESEMCRHWIALRRESLAAYRAEKKVLCQELEKRILARYPHLHGKLTLIDSWTPATYQRYTGGFLGAFMSFALLPGQLPKSTSNRVPGIQNLYLSTQWLQPPGGLPIAAKMGIQTANQLLEEIAVRTAAVENHTIAKTPHPQKIK